VKWFKRKEREPVVDPIWEAIDIFHGPERILSDYDKAQPEPGALFAAQFCQSEVCNGGFEQSFLNSKGVLAPEAIAAFRSIGMPQTAHVVQAACDWLPRPYPRDRVNNIVQELTALDDEFFEPIVVEAGGFSSAADPYAAKVIGAP
jgi:hypothetical protein